MPRRYIMVGLLIALTAAACSSDEPARDANGRIVAGGNASVFALQVGDCFDDGPRGEQAVADVTMVPCAQPHDNEIYHQYEMTEASFPGDDAVLESGSRRCFEAFTGFVGVDYVDSALDLFPITPTAGSWGNGDRIVVCALYAVDLSKLAGSMQGTRR